MSIKPLIAFSLLAAAAHAAAPGAPDEIGALVNRARSAPAEFAADALIRLAASDKIQAPERRRELLEEAFRHAFSAQQPLKQRAISTRGSFSAAFLDKAFQQNLDTLSLQCRAVRAMLPVNHRKARELFGQIALPQLRKLSCEDALVPDVSSYYETLAEIARTAFTAKEIAEDEPFQLVAGHITLQWPAQVGPVAELLARAPLTREQLDALVASFARTLADLSGDDRSFSYSVSAGGQTGPTIDDLVAACKKQNAAFLPLLEGYRAYLARQMSTARCADGAVQPVQAFGVDAASMKALARATMDPAQFFNETLRVDPVKPLADSEIQPSSVAGRAKLAGACESPECKSLAGQYSGLILDPKGVPYGTTAKVSMEWQDKVKDYLAALAAWKDDTGGTRAGYFQEKCVFYSDLFNVTPNGPERQSVLRAFLDFLKQNAYQRENRMEWFLPVNSLLARVSLDPAGLSELQHDLRNSQDPLIALYAALEEAVPRSPGDRLSIF